MAIRMWLSSSSNKVQKNNHPHRKGKLKETVMKGMEMTTELNI